MNYLQDGIRLAYSVHAVWGTVERQAIIIDMPPHSDGEKSEHRKVFMQQFQPSEVLLHRPAELEAARVLLQRLLDSPAKFESHLRQ